VFISPHKFVGGPGSPGVVVAKKWMFKNNVPDRVGGGTVVYVSTSVLKSYVLVHFFNWYNKGVNDWYG
jgi:selenocysteine lyase/cysteine desulfurase